MRNGSEASVQTSFGKDENVFGIKCIFHLQSLKAANTDPTAGQHWLLRLSVIIKLLMLTALRKFSIGKAEHRGKKDTYLAIFTEINMFFSASKKT